MKWPSKCLKAVCVNQYNNNSFMCLLCFFPDFSKNRLTEVPVEVCHFVSLEALNLYHNCIKIIPEALANLRMLTYLNIRYIYFTDTNTACQTAVYKPCWHEICAVHWDNIVIFTWFKLTFYLLTAPYYCITYIIVHRTWKLPLRKSSVSLLLCWPSYYFRRLNHLSKQVCHYKSFKGRLFFFFHFG